MTNSFCLLITHVKISLFYFWRIILLNLDLQVYGFSSSSTLKMLVLCFLFLMKICSHVYGCSSLFYVLFFSSCPQVLFFCLSLIFKSSNYDVTRHDFLELFCLDFTKFLEYVSFCLMSWIKLGNCCGLNNLLPENLLKS